jgi:hypothetical protein
MLAYNYNFATMKKCKKGHGILTKGRRLCTFDLLIKACFIKKVNNIFNTKGANLN